MKLLINNPLAFDDSAGSRSLRELHLESSKTAFNRFDHRRPLVSTTFRWSWCLFLWKFKGIGTTFLFCFHAVPIFVTLLTFGLYETYLSGKICLWPVVSLHRVTLTSGIVGMHGSVNFDPCVARKNSNDEYLSRWTPSSTKRWTLLELSIDVKSTVPLYEQMKVPVSLYTEKSC